MDIWLSQSKQRQWLLGLLKSKNSVISRWLSRQHYHKGSPMKISLKAIDFQGQAWNACGKENGGEDRARSEMEMAKSEKWTGNEREKITLCCHRFMDEYRKTIYFFRRLKYNIQIPILLSSFLHAIPPPPSLMLEVSAFLTHLFLPEKLPRPQNFIERAVTVLLELSCNASLMLKTSQA